MSALPQDPGSAQEPSQLHSDGNADAHTMPAGDASALQDQHVDIGNLIRAALANGVESGSGGELGGIAGAGATVAGEHVYDGHVPLALDSNFLPAIDTTLDLLTTATDLFDVPVVDFGASTGDAADV